MIEEKPSELLTLLTAFMRRKYEKYFFYGVSICDKHSAIVNIKENISDSIKPSKVVKYFGGKIPPLVFTFVMTFIHHNFYFLFF